MSASDKPLLGLALSSGGVLGYAHVGVLRALEELHVVPDMYSGASMGALAAVFSASGNDSFALESIADMFSTQVAVLLESFVPIGRLTMAWRLRAKLQKMVPAGTFEQLAKPVCIAATDVQTGDPVVYDSGDLWGPLSGSFCLPGIFPVVHFDEHYLLDGGLSLPVPVTELRKRGASKVLAVFVHDPSQDVTYMPDHNIARLLVRTVNLMLTNIARPELDMADLVLRPDLRGCSATDVRSYVERGYEAAMEQRSAIEELIA
ncbi:MAG: patatin-like phospholipase family protein [Caldisericota bacterium]|jgi:NTE family protein|nr:patatin-like phospholipase family protein [Caldisericota bacterium]